MQTRAKNEDGPPGALSHLRVVEFGDMPAAYCSRLLADLGADVVKVEPPSGDPNRWLPPFAGDIPGLERSLPFINANTNKRGVVLDLAGAASDRRLFMRLLGTADILVEATPVGTLEGLGFTQRRLLRRNPRLVTVSLTPFGQTGPYSRYKGSEAIIEAMSGLMYHQGDDTRPPCVAPSHQAYQVAASQAAFLALAAVRHRRRTGIGQRIDFSLQEAMTNSPLSVLSGYGQRSAVRGRPGIHAAGGGGNAYRCKDGRYVSMLIVLDSHWQTLVAGWMKDPVLSQPEWSDPQYRAGNADLVDHLISEFVAQFDAGEFAAEAQRRRLPVGPVNTLGEFLESAHLRERDWLQETDHPVIGRYQAPGPPFRMSETPLRIRRPAPLLGQHQTEVLSELEATQQPTVDEGSPAPSTNGVGRPMLEEIRVADLTRGGAGPICTQYLAFYGAEIVKVESAELEANRTSLLFVEFNRGKLSCSIDARRPQGQELLRRLVANSDVLIDNFSAGVIDRLSLGYEETRRIRPNVIQITMPGMGRTGPLRSWYTWGNQLLAYTGLTYLWGYPESPVEARAKIPFPDWVAGALASLATMAAIEYRDRTGDGQLIELAQVEGQGALLGPAILDYTVNGREWEPMGYREHLGAPYAPYGCYPCKGADEWIVIACETEKDWEALVRVMGEPSWTTDPNYASKTRRRDNYTALDERLAEWTQNFTPRQTMRMLQGAGVPAGIPLSGEDLYYDLHLRARGHIVEMDQARWGPLAYPGLPGLPSRSKAEPSSPTPWLGDHNDYVFGQLLHMSDSEIREYTEAGAIQ